MFPPAEKIITRYKENGSFTVLANLIFDLTLTGWIAFFGLYALEVLLPTFVVARLSLVKFAIVLFMLTSLLVWLGFVLQGEENESNRRNTLSPILLGLITATSIGIVALAHYRFPWWSIPISLGGYALALWLFCRFPKTSS